MNHHCIFFAIEPMDSCGNGNFSPYDSATAASQNQLATSSHPLIIFKSRQNKAFFLKLE
jgi:hypothetical protein